MHRGVRANSYTNDIVKQLPLLSFKNGYDNKDGSLHNINFLYKDTTTITKSCTRYTRIFMT